MLHSTSTPFAHTALEALGYFVGARIYWRQSIRQPGPSGVDRMLIVGCVIFLAALGSKALHVAEHAPALLAQGQVQDWLSGKSVLGGLVGGTLGAEIGKRWIGWTAPTGDAWVPAIAAGLMIGRAGCQVSGLWDQTYGNPTTLPWGWDYGDGIPRHPVALYEISGVALAWSATHLISPAHRGARYAAFMLAYCLLRLALDMLKPPFAPVAPGTLAVASYAGLSAIQWLAAAGAAGFAILLHYRLQPST